MTSQEYLEQQIDEKLGNDTSRVAELFEDESVFDKLVALDDERNWQHYSRKTFDGWYLVKTPDGFQSYYQERFIVFGLKTFKHLRDAAEYHFKACHLL